MGTLFLDEVGGLDLSIQAKLLQVLQDGSFMRVGAQESRSVKTRLVCAANEDLRQQTENGSLRLDFFYRINAVTIELPPLRERAADIPKLIEYFLAVHSKAYNLEPRPLSREIIRMMQRYNWPGNIRQLENLIRGYVLLGDEESLAADLVPVASTGIVPEIDLANPDLPEGDHQGCDTGAGERDHSEGAAGEWLEPEKDGQMAEYQLSIAVVQTAGVRGHCGFGKAAEERNSGSKPA